MVRVAWITPCSILNRQSDPGTKSHAWINTR